MSRTLSITAYKEADESFERLKKIYELCEEEGIDPPSKAEVAMSSVSTEGPPGIEIPEYGDIFTDFSDINGFCYRIELSKLPPEVAYIEVELS